jgi:hypothetical protein
VEVKLASIAVRGLNLTKDRLLKNNLLKAKSPEEKVVLRGYDC